MPIQNEYEAISVDTSIVDANKMLFEKGALRQLRQFKGSDVRFVVSDIVRNEIKDHLTKKNDKILNSLKKGVEDSDNHLILGNELGESLRVRLNNESSEQLAEKRLKQFFEDTGAELVKTSDNLDVEQLVSSYFNSSAPFEETGKKKNEFPDALALLSIKAFAEKEGIRVVLVSTDKDWEKFASAEERLVLFDSLPTALAHFNKQALVTAIKKQIQRDCVRGEDNEVLSAIKNSIDAQLEYADVGYPDACSSFYYELDSTWVEYTSHELLFDKGKLECQLISADDEEIVLQFSADVKCKVHGEFSLFAKDFIDKDYVSIGSTHASVDEQFFTDIIVTLIGDVEDGLDGLDVQECEMVESISNVDFGEIEPDWRQNPEW